MSRFSLASLFSAACLMVCLGVSAQDAQPTAAALGAPQAKAVVVPIPDASLEAALRKAINKPAGSILDADLAQIDELAFINNAKNGRLNGYHQEGETVLQVTGFTTLIDGEEVRIDGDSTTYILVSHTAGTLTITPGLSGAIPAVPSGTLVTVGGLPGGGIVNLSGMEYCSKLLVLDLTGNSISDLTPLGDLPRLTHVFLTDNKVADLTPLSGISTLQGISLAGNQVVNLAPLSSLTNLSKLDLWKNRVADLSPLAGLPHLEWLDLRENQISNTAPLAGITTLTGLALDNNPIGNAGLANLSALTNITRLAVNFTQISTLAPVQAMVNLHILAAGGNTITNFSPLVNNAGIADGDYVFVGTAIGPPVDCTSISLLRDRGVIVDDLDACQPAPDRNTDRDADGLSDYDEVMHYCDPTDNDSDKDGMPDGWEVASRLEPLNRLDDNYDPDGDATCNLDEYLGQTDPNNPNSPTWTGYVAPNGNDTFGSGSRFAPWKTINHAISALTALNPPAGTAVTVFVRPGTYNEGLVTLPANFRLWGIDYYRVQGVDPNQTEVTVIGRIIADYPVLVTNINLVPETVTPPADTDALLTVVSPAKRLNAIWNAPSNIDRVRFPGASGGVPSGWTCIDIKNSTADQTVIHRCEFRNSATAVRVQGALPNINGNVFRNLSGDVLLILPTAVSTASGGLGSAVISNTGINLLPLSGIQGMAVNNQSSLPVTVENNEWGTMDPATIQGHFSGSVVPPTLILPAGATGNLADVYVVVYDAVTKERILNATVTVNDYPTPVTQNRQGVYPFAPLMRIGHTFTISVAGYVPVTKTIPVPLQLDQTALLIPMYLPSVEGEGEGEGEGEPLDEMAQELYDDFEAVDTNNDCLISLEEAQAAQPSLTAEDFAVLDANSDGMLSEAELDAYLGLTGCHCKQCHECSPPMALLAAIIALAVAAFGFFVCLGGC